MEVGLGLNVAAAADAPSATGTNDPPDIQVLCATEI